MEVKVLFSPQMNETDALDYQFEGEKVISILNGETEEYDFSTLTEGRAELEECSLPFCPIVEAYRINGVLYVRLIRFVTRYSPEEELYPDWEEH